MNVRRVFIATGLGFVFGILSWLLLTGTYQSVPRSGIATIVLSRTILGFAIGISAWKTSWWLHGLALGFVFSLPSAFGSRWMGMPWVPDVLCILLAGIVIGFLIELLTSRVFRQAQG